jgi:hypothetical protein
MTIVPDLLQQDRVGRPTTAAADLPYDLTIEATEDPGFFSTEMASTDHNRWVRFVIL